MKEVNKKALLWIAIASILFNELLIFGGWGISVPISVIIYYALVLWQSKSLKIKSNMKNNILLIPITMISLCFVLFDNTLLKFLNVIFLYVLIILNTSQIFGINRFEFLSLKWIMEIVPIGIISPFQHMVKPIKLFNGEAKEEYKKSVNVVIKILIGCAIGSPIVVIAIILLMNSDAAFENLIKLISESFSFNILDVLGRIIVFIIVFFPMYGYFYGIWNRNEKVNFNKEEKKTQIKLDFTIITTATSLLGIVYFIYSLVQFNYFISAFKGILPTDYTFSQYARKGFFECIPLGFINLLGIIVLKAFTKVGDSKGKIKLIKGYIFYFVAFTLFLVISALSKMLLYISAYGITLMRVYVAWFLILGCIILILIGLKTYTSKIKLSKSIFIFSTIMFLILNYANIDYRIARYDADLYIAGKVNTIDAFKELSNSALEPLIDISKTNKKETSSLLKKYQNRLNEKEKWQDWNLVIYKAKNIFNE